MAAVLWRPSAMADAGHEVFAATRRPLRENGLRVNTPLIQDAIYSGNMMALDSASDPSGFDSLHCRFTA